MDSLDLFQQSRRVVEDFTSRTLAAVPGDFGRLSYVSSLKDPATGRYQHDGLIAVYSEDSVQAALAHCHLELFARILETPLAEQEADLRRYLRCSEGVAPAALEQGAKRKSLQELCPENLPDYLTDLFCSNCKALMAVSAAK